MAAGEEDQAEDHADHRLPDGERKRQRGEKEDTTVIGLPQLRVRPGIGRGEIAGQGTPQMQPDDEFVDAVMQQRIGYGGDDREVPVHAPQGRRAPAVENDGAVHHDFQAAGEPRDENRPRPRRIVGRTLEPRPNEGRNVIGNVPGAIIRKAGFGPGVSVDADLTPREAIFRRRQRQIGLVEEDDAEEGDDHLRDEVAGDPAATRTR